MRVEVISVGLRGEQGATGETGPEGPSAYDVAVENGFEGTEEEWLASLADVSAADVAFTPAAGLSSINVQDAIEELAGAASSGLTDTTLAALNDIADAVNTSGKVRNKLVVDENERVWRAVGADADSIWWPIDDPAGIEAITPA